MGAQQSTSALPATMRRLVLTHGAMDFDGVTIAVEECPIPTPRSGEVLVKVVAAPVNPSDYGKWKGKPGPPPKPVAMGLEGSGTVVASGGGVMAGSMVGKRIGFTNPAKGQGSYSEYVTVSALQCFPMPDEVPLEDACSFFVNPFTAYAIVDTARSRGSPGLVLTAAASQLGQMLVKLCKEERYPIVCVVRREAQAETLRALGAEHVVVTAGGEAKELKEVVAQLGITVAFDAVAGPMTAALLAALPNKSTVYVFGRLSGEPAHCPPLDLIYFEKKVEGFLVAGHAGSWLRKDGLLKMGLRQRACAQRVCPALAEGGWAASTFVDCTPDTMWASFLSLYKSEGFTGKKLRVRLDGGADATSAA